MEKKMVHNVDEKQVVKEEIEQKNVDIQIKELIEKNRRYKKWQRKENTTTEK